jgi:hypothetical protein
VLDVAGTGAQVEAVAGVRLLLCVIFSVLSVFLFLFFGGCGGGVEAVAAVAEVFLQWNLDCVCISNVICFILGCGGGCGGG